MADTSSSELACVYSALILHDDDVDITVCIDAFIFSAANDVKISSLWTEIAWVNISILKLSCLSFIIDIGVIN